MKKANVLAREGIKFFCMVMSVACLIVGSSSNGSAKPARSCDEDITRFCKDVQRGGGQVVKCLQEHDKDVTRACKQEMTEMKTRMKGFKEFCGDDVQKYCKDVTPGEGRIIQCLKGYEPHLSLQCKSNLPPMR